MHHDVLADLARRCHSERLGAGVGEERRRPGSDEVGFVEPRCVTRAVDELERRSRDRIDEGPGDLWCAERVLGAPQEQARCRDLVQEVGRDDDILHGVEHDRTGSYLVGHGVGVLQEGVHGLDELVGDVAFGEGSAEPDVLQHGLHRDLRDGHASHHGDTELGVHGAHDQGKLAKWRPHRPAEMKDVADAVRFEGCGADGEEPSHRRGHDRSRVESQRVERLGHEPIDVFEEPGLGVDRSGGKRTETTTRPVDDEAPVPG